MDVREKLVEILKQAPFEGKVLDEWWWEEKIRIIADHLIRNGVTVRDAMTALNDKLFEDMPEDERIEAFVKAHEAGKQYPTMDFFDWHNKLTGSCEAGRKAFAQNHGVDLNGSMTVMEFIALTEHDYGGGIIKKLRAFYEERSDGDDR